MFDWIDENAAFARALRRPTGPQRRALARLLWATRHQAPPRSRQRLALRRQMREASRIIATYA